METLSKNGVYKKYVGNEIPYDVFIEIETRKYNESKERDKVSFIVWLNRKYARAGKRAWYNRATQDKLTDIGYLNVTAEQVKDWSETSASVADTLGKAINIFKKTPTTASTPVIQRQTPTPTKQGLSTGAIVGIVFGAIAFTAIMGTLIYVASNRK